VTADKEYNDGKKIDDKGRKRRSLYSALAGWLLAQIRSQIDCLVILS